MQQHGSKYYHVRRYPLTLGMGSIGQNSTNSEYGHGAYQIKENHEFSNMAANILPAYPPPPTTLGIRSIGQNSLFSEHGHVAYQIKWKREMQQHGSKYIFCPQTPDAPDLVNRSKSTFSDHGHVAYQIKGNYECSNMEANTLHADPPSPKVWGQKIRI